MDCVISQQVLVFTRLRGLARNTREHGAGVARGRVSVSQNRRRRLSFGVCLHGPFLVSRFHKRIAWSKQCRAGSNAAIIHGEAAPWSSTAGRADAFHCTDRRSRQIQRTNPNAARLSAQPQGMPRSNCLIVMDRGWLPSMIASAMSGTR